MARTLKEKLMIKDIWVRLVFMVLFSLLLHWGIFFLIIIIAGVQFVYSFFTGSANKNLLIFSVSLNEYTKQVINYLIYHSEEKPFPFTSWPKIMS
jgi:hypothetical protein